MKRFYIACGRGAVVGLFLLIPFVSSQAYTLKDENVYRISDTLVLFTQTFSFSVVNSDAYISYQAQPATVGEKDPLNSALQFTISADGAVRSDTVATALLFSNAPNVNQLYQVTKRQPQTFTLAAFVTLPAELTDLTQHELSMQLTSLPFTVFAENSVRKFFYPLPNAKPTSDETTKTDISATTNLQVGN